MLPWVEQEIYTPEELEVIRAIDGGDWPPGLIARWRADLRISEFILLCEAATLGMAAATGLDPLRIAAAQEIGRRRGRRDAAAKGRGVARLCRLMDEEPPSAA